MRGTAFGRLYAFNATKESFVPLHLDGVQMNNQTPRIRAKVWIADSVRRITPRRNWSAIPVMLLTILLMASGPFARAFAQDRSSAMRQTVSVNRLQAPDEARTAVARARQALLHGKLERASSEIERALRAYPTYALAFALRGSMRIRQNQLQQACSDFQQAIQNDPSLGAGYLGLGATYNLLGRFEEAIVPLNQSVEILPDAWPTHFQIAIAYYHTGQYQAAWREIAKAQTIGVRASEDRAAIRQLNAQVLLKLNSDSTAEDNLEANGSGKP